MTVSPISDGGKGLWCPVCGRLVASRVPKGGDGSARIVARHGNPVCEGSSMEAEWEAPAGRVELELVAGSRRRRRAKTSTSKFGVSARQSHDASRYYNRALEHAQLDAADVVNPLPPGVANMLFCHTSEVMSELPDNSVALTVTSPSYHVGKDYDLDIGFVDFLAMLYRVFAETYRVLEPGGRLAVNVANLGRKPYVFFSDHVAQACKEIGFLPRGEILWVKGKGANGSIAVGSFRSPSNPVLRDVHEYIMCFSKGRYDRAPSRKKRRELGLPHQATMAGDDFMRATLSVWNIRPESAKRVGHPAPFPVEIPRRLIELYTYADDVVLDPFMGSGSTAVAAAATGRRYVGYDLDAEYLSRARERIANSCPIPPAQEVS